MMQRDKFVFVVVHPPRQRKKQPLFKKLKSLKILGSKSPFTTVTQISNQNQDQSEPLWRACLSKSGLKLRDQTKTRDIDYYGVVTFEVALQEIVGMDYKNVLIEDSSRFVLEARTVVKRSFETVEAFFNFYKLESSMNGFYRPSLDKNSQLINITRAFPFEDHTFCRKQEEEESSTLESHCPESVVLDQRALQDVTIIAYFDDPILPLALKELINRPD